MLLSCVRSQPTGRLWPRQSLPMSDDSAIHLPSGENDGRKKPCGLSGSNGMSPVTFFSAPVESFSVQMLVVPQPAPWRDDTKAMVSGSVGENTAASSMPMWCVRRCRPVPSTFTRYSSDSPRPSRSDVNTIHWPSGEYAAW